MSEKFVKELHRALCNYYVSQNGKSISRLQSWRFNLAECVTIPELKKVVDKFITDETRDSLVRNAFDEMTIKGYLVRLEWGYNLTELGLQAGTRNLLDSILDSLNRNPGLISTLALIISVIALYISYSKL